MSAVLLRAAIAELRRLRDGGEPHARRCGICRNVAHACHQVVSTIEAQDFGYDLCADTFMEMGLCPDHPLGDYDENYISGYRTRWCGEWGVLRRELCGKMLTHLQSKYPEEFP